MTLVAAFLLDGQPVVVADILTCSGHPLYKIHATPTGHDVAGLAEQQSTGLHIVDVVQKVTIIGDSCAIAWAGTYIEAAAVIRDLVERNESDPLTYESVMGYFAHEIGSVGIKDPITFVGFAKDGESYRLFEYEAEKISSEAFGEIVAAGSGCSHLRQLISESVFSNSRHGDMEIPDYEKAISKVLGVIGPLLTNEVATGGTLDHYYGGGYEIAAIIDDQAKKINEVIYLLGVGYLDDSRFKIQASHLFKYYYQGDILSIHVIDYQKSQNTFDTYVLKPMTRYLSKGEKFLFGEVMANAASPGFMFSYKEIVCIVILVEFPDGSTSIKTATAFYPSSHFMLSVEESDDGNVEVKLGDKYLDSLKVELRESLKGRRGHRVVKN